MASVTVKIPSASLAKPATLAEDQQRPMSDLLAELIEAERRRRFLHGLNDDLARLRADPAAWADYQAEIRSMDGTMIDGLADDPWEE